MMNYQIIQLSTHFKIEIVQTSFEKNLSRDVIKAIDLIWEKEILTRPIFNGKIFCVLSFHEQTLTGQFIEYKTYLARLRDPALKEFLPIYVLGVTGITQWRNQFLFGKRSEGVTLYPGHYEFAPAGGVDLGAVNGNCIDLQKQILIELEEEVRLQEHEVSSIAPWILMRDKYSGDYEVCLHIHLDPQYSHAEIAPTPEYSSCLWIEADQLHAFILKPALSFVPFTYSLLQQI